MITLPHSAVNGLHFQEYTRMSLITLYVQFAQHPGILLQTSSVLTDFKRIFLALFTTDWRQRPHSPLRIRRFAPLQPAFMLVPGIVWMGTAAAWKIFD